MNKEQIVLMIEQLKDQYLENLRWNNYMAMDKVKKEIKYWEKRLEQKDYYDTC